MDIVCPKLSEKEGGGTRVSYSGYTIKDYLTLGKGFIFTASGKLAPLRKKAESAYTRFLLFPVGLRQPSRGK